MDDMTCSEPASVYVHGVW